MLLIGAIISVLAICCISRCILTKESCWRIILNITVKIIFHFVLPELDGFVKVEATADGPISCNNKATFYIFMVAYMILFPIFIAIVPVCCEKPQQPDEK